MTATPASTVDVAIDRVSPAVEQFLRVLASLGGAEASIATNRLATALGVRDPSVTTMAKRLHALGLVDHTPYHGLRLTPDGERVAGQVAYRHQLIERTLAATLGLSDAEAHTEAERLELHVSDRLASRIAGALDTPSDDREARPTNSAAHRL